ncbi:hypothetical protein [Micromonospora sp. KC213]|uniref:hypothetical protein n=1 Tax=Micromonospora sp. KC213 TaxID=2530378 RepID=UPI00104BCA15|nr:hypothetical protein [Micromonospora sp. KC213]TDC41846.1 hypothetical protein E1166_09975 [Micromonospora sp. KC213]
MGEVLPMPGVGDLFTDLRGDDRMMRVSYHPERSAVVLSLWRGAVCRGSFRLAVEEAGRLRALLEAIEARAAPPAGAAVGREAAPEAAEVVQTGDVSDAARRVALPVVPAPRVA